MTDRKRSDITLRYLGVLLTLSLLVAAWLLGGSFPLNGSSDGGEKNVKLTIKRAKHYQTVEGFGAEINNWAGAGGRVHGCPLKDTVPEADKNKILDLLYGDLGLTSDRSYVSTGGSSFDRFRTLKPIFIEARKRALANGDDFRVNLSGWVTDAFRDSKGRLSLSGAGGYANWATNGLKQLRDQLGITVAYWDIAPEPDGVGSLRPAEFKAVLATTAAAFKTAGLDVRIAVPRTVTVSGLFDYAIPILSDPATRRYVSQLTYHEYDHDASRRVLPDITSRNRVSDLAHQYKLTVAMRETSSDLKENRTTFWNGSYDQAMAWANDVMTDVVEADAGAWDLILAYYVRNTPNFGADSYIIMDYANCVYTGFEIPPHYWTLRQFVKFVRPGAVRIGASSNSRDVRVAAFADSKRQQTIVVAINNATTDLAVRVAGVPDGTASVIQTTQTHVGAPLPQITAQKGQVAAALPARSVTTFVFGP